MDQCITPLTKFRGLSTAAAVVTARSVAAKPDSSQRQSVADSTIAIRADPVCFQCLFGIEFRQEYQTNIPLALMAWVVKTYIGRTQPCSL